MPGKAKPGKQRTSSAAKKRFRKTGKGTIVNQKAANNHLLQQKSKKQKSKAKHPVVTEAYGKTLKRMMPN